jgi:hypothetical protein
MRRLLTVLAIIAASTPGAAVPAWAAAGRGGPTKYLAPPGNSAVAQYLEVVPTDAGAAPASVSASSKPSVAVAPAQQRELSHYGATGRTLATVVGETAERVTSTSTSGSVWRLKPQLARRSHATSHRPGARRSRRASRNRSRRAGTVPAAGHRAPPAASGRSPVAAVLSAATGREVGGGVGFLLPLLALGGLVVVVVAVTRRRGTRGP